MKISTKADIDIDVYDRDKVLSGLNVVYARENKEGKKHNTGVYFNPIPVNPFTNVAVVDYKEAAELGYFKVDFLNLHIYENVKSEAHLVRLINEEPMWEMLEHREIVNKLFQLNQHFDLVEKLKPDSIEKLAALIAIIRPAKRHLANKSWETIFREVWKKPRDGAYYFKKAHSFSYAMAIVAQMNLIVEETTYS